MLDQRTQRLFACAKQILYDQCPQHPEHYLCRESETYDESACTRCWENYLYRVINNEV